MTRFRLFLVACAALVTACRGSSTSDNFLVAPYLQLGDRSALSPEEGLSLLWHSADLDRAWAVRFRRKGARTGWRAAGLSYSKVGVEGIDAHRVYEAALAPLVPGGEFEYQVLLGGAPVFSASGRARKAASATSRFVVMGDTAQGTAAQKQIAVRIAAGDPDYVFIAGDIVYSRGRISEYREKFFPVFNRDEKDPAYGAPLLRSIPFVAAPGNHDLGRDFSIATDLLAYFLYWRQPLNGPAAAGPAPSGPPAAVGRFTAAAGGRFPRMANFSFDYGNVHWVALDSMPYMDWTSPVLREWLAADLKAVPASTWKLAGFHHPGFNSSRAHFNEQRMRVLAPLFEECGVDIVFNGHVHNYQRSFPLTFVPRRQPDGSFYLANGNVEGAWTLDRAFDGTPAKRPRGVLYIVTGGGGAGLYNPEQQSAPATWQPFTAKFVSSVHSLTLVEAGPQKLVLRQVSALGQELDSLVLTK